MAGDLVEDRGQCPDPECRVIGDRQVMLAGLLGLTPVTEKTAPKTARLRKRLQKVEALPPADQRTVLKLVDALAEARQRTRPTRARAAS